MAILDKVHASKHQDQTVLEAIFREAVATSLSSLEEVAAEVLDIRRYKLLIAYSAGFMGGEGALLTVHLERLALELGEVEFVRNNILNYNLLHSFIFFFSSSN